MFMSMFCIKRFIVLFALIGVQLPVFSLEPTGEQDLIHYTLYYPPYWDGTQSNIVGLHSKLSRRLYAQAKLDIKIERVPYVRIHRHVLPENVAIVAYGINPLTDHRYLFPIPKTKIELKVYGLYSEPTHSLDQLEGKAIAIMRNFSLGSFEMIREEKKYKTVSTNTAGQAIRLLLAGRVDYIVVLDEIFQKDIKEIDSKGKKIWSRTLEKLAGWPIAIVKSHPRANELNEKIKRAYEELLKVGVISYKNQQLLLTEDL